MIDRHLTRIFSLSLCVGLSLPLTAAIETDHQKLSYAMGMYITLTVQQENIELDTEAFIEAVRDVLEGKESQMSRNELQTILANYREEILAKRQGNNEENRKIGDAFLAKNKQKEGVTTLPSGLQYKIIRNGDGEKPTAESIVTVDYQGRLIDGTVFDDSSANGEAATFSLQQVIKGWQEAIPMMTVGSKWQLYIPADLAYGDNQASELITPGSTLIFDVELLSIQ